MSVCAPPRPPPTTKKNTRNGGGPVGTMAVTAAWTQHANPQHRFPRDLGVKMQADRTCGTCDQNHNIEHNMTDDSRSSWLSTCIFNILWATYFMASPCADIWSTSYNCATMTSDICFERVCACVLECKAAGAAAFDVCMGMHMLDVHTS